MGCQLFDYAELLNGRLFNTTYEVYPCVLNGKLIKSVFLLILERRLLNVSLSWRWQKHLPQY